MSSTRKSILALARAPSLLPKRVDRPTVGLVLSGGGARGAYEAGVLRYLCEEFPRTTGVQPWFDIVCGTSVGALNACFVAATADVLDRSTALLAQRWSELKVGELVQVRPMELLRLARSLLGGAPIPLDAGSPSRRGGLIDTTNLERFVLESVAWSRIRRNVEEGVVRAVSVSATHVSSGKTVVFVDSPSELPPWSRDPHVRARRTRITPWHALASAAIPLLFPPMAIEGAYYVDGGLRQNTPLSPAIRLGADRVLVMSLRYRAPEGPNDLTPLVHEESVPSPFFLAGKALNALLIDRVDYDLDRLRRMNAIAMAGIEVYGPDFLEKVNGRIESTITEHGGALRVVRDMLVRPSCDLGALAAEYAQTDAFVDGAGLTGRAFRRLAERDARTDADLLSYLLFDGAFGAQLIELGMQDARKRRDEFVSFFTV